MRAGGQTEGAACTVSANLAAVEGSSAACASDEASPQGMYDDEAEGIS